jgi:hypothetical protein
MASDIQITSLTAVGGVGSIALLAEWAAPAILSSLPYMQLASVVFYISATNNFNTATVAGESVTGVLSIGSLPLSATRYIWARAKDPAGNLGPRYPVAGGVSVTTANTNPGPNSVGTSELQNGAVTTAKIDNLAVTNAKIDNLAVTNAKIANLSADKITAGTISATIAINGPTITGGVVRTSTSSTRVEMNSANNAVDVYRGGVLVGWFGNAGGGNVLSVSNGTNGAAANLIGGVAGGNAAAVNIFNNLNGQGLFSRGGSGTSGHGIRGQAGNSGGMGLVGSATGHAFYAETGTYGPFTGNHDAMILKGEAVNLGEIVCSTGRVLSRSGVDDALLEVVVSSEEKQKGAYGIVSLFGPFDPFSLISALPPLSSDEDVTPVRRYLADNFTRLAVNGCGEGLVLVCGRGGDIEVGDYICTSSMRGKGQRQNDETGNADDLLRRHTVAQATQSVKFSDPDEVQLVACIYKCG